MIKKIIIIVTSYFANFKQIKKLCSCFADFRVGQKLGS